MPIALISGSGFYALPGLSAFDSCNLETPFGVVSFHSGTWQGQELIFLARHGFKHSHLSHQINHRGHLALCQMLGVEAILACSIVGVLNPDLPLGSLFLPQELYFPDNRLPDGSACSLFVEPAQPGRGHLIAASHFNQALGLQLQSAAENLGLPLKTHLTYAQVQGPRFNSKPEIRALAGLGVDILSQTLGPEAVLAGELEIPYAALCFGVDYANGVQVVPTPIETLQTHMQASKEQFLNVLARCLADYQSVNFEGFVYRFD
jgi:5'-methylthioadenosine phosphorylase